MDSRNGIKSSDLKTPSVPNSRDASKVRHMKCGSAGGTFIQTPTGTSSKMNTLVPLGKTGNMKDLQSGPGPGAYFKELKIGGVSYAIGRSKRVHERKQLSVGPGDYDLPSSPMGISFSMTPRRRQLKKIDHVPGPGTYTPTHENPGIKYSVSRADRDKARLTQSPGPGSYSIRQPKSSRSAL